MPTYNFNCTACGDCFEYTNKIADRDQPTEWPCEECKQMTVIRVPNSVGFALNDAQKAPTDFKNLLSNIKRKNSTLTKKSTINDNGI
jgi:putative FmdB family regulatory protein